MNVHWHCWHYKGDMLDAEKHGPYLSKSITYYVSTDECCKCGKWRNTPPPSSCDLDTYG